MSTPRARIGFDNRGDTVYAEAKDDYVVITTMSEQIVLYPEAYAELVKYVEQSRVAA